MVSWENWPEKAQLAIASLENWPEQNPDHIAGQERAQQAIASLENWPEKGKGSHGQFGGLVRIRPT